MPGVTDAALPGADVVELDTPSGLARAHVLVPDDPVGALLLGHGAGGSVQARDIRAAAGAALGLRLGVALVEQPYLVAGRKSAAPAPKLDAAWTAVSDVLRAGPLAAGPLVAGGRSSGARVACRTAAATGADRVLCLAFPLHPPRRRADAERVTRLPELDAVAVPVLVVQGARDPFGMPPPGPDRTVVALDGDHRLASDLPGVEHAVRSWLQQLLRRTR